MNPKKAMNLQKKGCPNPSNREKEPPHEGVAPRGFVITTFASTTASEKKVNSKKIKDSSKQLTLTNPHKTSSGWPSP